MSARRPPALTPGHALFLDVDGTLLEIAPRPDAVVVPHALPDVLAALVARLDGAVALLSGRSLEALQELLPVPGLAMVGSHGGESTLWPAAQAAPLAESVLDACRAELARWPGALLETKPFGVALHWRGCPAAAEPLRRLAQSLAERFALSVQSGHCVVELMTTTLDKASALRRAMTAPPYRGRVPVMVGDDAPDFAAMALARALGGFSVHVTREAPARGTHGLQGPAEVIAWLAATH